MQKNQQDGAIHKGAWAGVIGGAALWGTVGLFISPLTAIGFSTMDIAMLRMVGAFLLMLPILAYWKPGIFKLHKPSDILWFGLMGTVSLGLFQWCYLSAIDELGMSLAVVLLYTAPAMVVIMARFVFHEPITRRKVTAICIMIAGCVFVLELPSGTAGQISTTGLFFGLGAGFSFALYNVTSKIVLQRYSVITVTIYTFLFASFGLIPFADIYSTPQLLASGSSWFWLGMIILLSTVMAYGLYLGGLQKIESGRATLAAVTELLVAVLLGVIIAGDRFSFMMGGGVVLVVFAVLMISRGKAQKFHTAKTPH